MTNDCQQDSNSFLECGVPTDITWNCEFFSPYQEQPLKHSSEFLLGYCSFNSVYFQGSYELNL